MADLLDLARRAVEVATAAGAEFADVEVSEGRSRSVSIEKSSLHATSDRIAGGISVRAIVKGASGFSSDARLTGEAAEECARRAASAAKLAEADPDFVRLPSPEPYEDVEGLFDPEIESVDVPWLMDMILGEVAGAREAVKGTTGRILVEAGASASTGTTAFANSCGVEYERSSSSIGCSVSPTVKEGDDVGSFFDFDRARRMSEFAPAGIGRKAAETAVSFRGARRAPTKELPVVLGPLASYALVSSVAAAAGAEGIQRGRSFLIGRLGERIASEHLTLVDDGLVPGGLASGALDGEGSVRRRVTVVGEGVFAEELHGLYTAGKARAKGRDVRVTGHGTRGGGTGPTNVRPALGTEASEEIIAETDEGIYVNYGGVVPDMVSGEISASVDFGFKIEGGRLAYPLRNTMLGVNVFDLLGSLDAVSSDYREEPGMVMPTMRFGKVRVASEAAGGRGR